LSKEVVCVYYNPNWQGTGVRDQFFTARFAQDAEVAKGKYYFFSAERAEKK
jgi:hypothetical protein